MITTQDALIAAFHNPQTFWIQKTSAANKLAGGQFSFYRTGPIPAIPAIPSTATLLDAGSPGALVPLQTTPNTKIALGGLGASCTALIGEVRLCDRLAHMGGLLGTLTTDQAVNLGLPPRAPSTGAGVQWYLEWYADTGATVATVTITYTNQDGISGRTTTVALTASMRAERLLRILPSGADTDIQSIQSIRLSASTLTAGNFGVTAILPIQVITPQLINTTIEKDYAECCLAPIDDNACLMMHAIFLATAAATITLSGTLIRG